MHLPGELPQHPGKHHELRFRQGGEEGVEEIFAVCLILRIVALGVEQLAQALTRLWGQILPAPDVEGLHRRICNSGKERTPASPVESWRPVAAVEGLRVGIGNMT